jgi:hypothetical protein
VEVGSESALSILANEGKLYTLNYYSTGLISEDNRKEKYYTFLIDNLQLWLPSNRLGSTPPFLQIGHQWLSPVKLGVSTALLEIDHRLYDSSQDDIFPIIACLAKRRNEEHVLDFIYGAEYLSNQE